MASDPPVITETRNLSIRQVSNGYVLSGSVQTTTVTPPATQGFTTSTSIEIIAATTAEVIDATTTFLGGGPLEDEA